MEAPVIARRRADCSRRGNLKEHSDCGCLSMPRSLRHTLWVTRDDDRNSP